MGRRMAKALSPFPMEPNMLGNIKMAFRMGMALCFGPTEVFGWANGRVTNGWAGKSIQKEKSLLTLWLFSIRINSTMVLIYIDYI